MFLVLLFRQFDTFGLIAILTFFETSYPFCLKFFNAITLPLPFSSDRKCRQGRNLRIYKQIENGRSPKNPSVFKNQAYPITFTHSGHIEIHHQIGLSSHGHKNISTKKTVSTKKGKGKTKENPKTNPLLLSNFKTRLKTGGVWLFQFSYTYNRLFNDT